MEEDLRILTEDEIEKKLKDFPGWEYRDNKITKKFQFGSFDEAVQFVEKLAPFSNRIDHHPDVHIYYKKIVFDLQRFSVGGKVTPRDFTVASEIERLFAAK
ncbi:MAG: pterin-4-alpha-carbinolamine dehydratase [uncultured bacterium]|nr:MAG: pterin-4-alpha-carbinolamine dehydratase [uncultured bacterium]